MLRLPAGLAALASSTLICSIVVAGSADDQLKRLEQRARDRPHDFVALTMLGELRAAQARQTGELQFYGNAADAFDAALAEFSDHAPALLGLGSVRMALHRFSDARVLAEKVLHSNASNVGAQLLLGDAQLAMGDDAAAQKTFAPLADSPAVFSRRAELARLHGANDDAIRLLLRAAEESEARGESPENITWYHTRAGEMFFRTGKFDEAERQYHFANTQSPDSYLVTEHIAELCGAQEKFDEAAALYEKLIAQSHRPDLEQAVGDLYLFAKKPEEAKTHYHAALSGYLASVHRGEVHFIHHLAGFYCDALEDGKEATEWARRDLELRQTPAAHEALAWALYRAGEFGEGRAEIGLALRSGIRDAHILYHAALIYSAAGELQRGEQLLREAAEVNPRYNSFHVHR